MNIIVHLTLPGVFKNFIWLYGSAPVWVIQCLGAALLSVAVSKPGHSHYYKIKINDGVLVRHSCLPVQFTASAVTYVKMHLKARSQKST